MHKRLNAILLIAILALAASLRFYWLGGSSLWSDEGNTWALIGRSFAQIAWHAAADIHPPGYYWTLKVWTAVFGATAVGMRSFSAFCGVALIGVIYAIGRRLDRNNALHVTALLAAFIAALNPFQIYYSQEARMYILLALESAGLFWALFALLGRQKEATGLGAWRTWLNWPTVSFLLFGIAGLWTHYSFPIILAAATLTFLIDWLRPVRPPSLGSQPLLHFIILNILVIVAYLPWLPTAIDRVLNWPSGGKATTLEEGLTLTLQTLLFGPLRELPSPLWPWLIGAGLLPILGIIAVRRARIMPGLAIWMLAPIGLMFGLGLFSDAFLKFLLVASPAWALLTAASGQIVRFKNVGAALLAGGAVAAALVSLPGYYHNPTARDNYAGIARYIEAVGDPIRDLVLLNAPGQQEVWSYYATKTPVLALPEARPPDRGATEDSLTAGVADRDRIFALLWATDESDPDGIVESWLDTHAFPGLDSWQGNVRFITYSLADDLSCTSLASPLLFGGAIELMEVCRAPKAEAKEGEAALFGFRWQALTPLETRYKMSVQLLDQRGQVIAQQDSEPAGGAQPTVDWAIAQPVDDNRGLPIPAGTPPGEYRLIIAVYAAETGERLRVEEQDYADLGTVIITDSATSLPVELLPISTRIDARLGPLTLVGYDQHKVGFAHAPETSVARGDQLEYILYWQAPDPLPANWPDDQQFTLQLGAQRVTMPLAGGGFPTADWEPGKVVRAVVQLPFDGNERRATITVNTDTKELESLP